MRIGVTDRAPHAWAAVYVSPLRAGGDPSDLEPRTGCTRPRGLHVLIAAGEIASPHGCPGPKTGASVQIDSTMSR